MGKLTSSRQCNVIALSLAKHYILAEHLAMTDGLSPRSYTAMNSHTAKEKKVYADRHFDHALRHDPRPWVDERGPSPLTEGFSNVEGRPCCKIRHAMCDGTSSDTEATEGKDSDCVYSSRSSTVYIDSQHGLQC